MWGENHPLPIKSKIKERLIGRFSLGQSVWIGTGLYLSSKMSNFIGPLTIFHNFIFQRIHYGIPLLICAFFGFARHNKTGLMYGKYLILMLDLRFRRRTFLYRKMNTKEGGDY